MPATALAHQPNLFEPCPVAGAVAAMALSSKGERGAIFTRREVVEFILDLAGYVADRPLHRQRLLEPSFGGGDFLLPAVERLLTAYAAGGGRDPARDLHHCVVGVELHAGSARQTAADLNALLIGHGCQHADAAALCRAWLKEGDFLLADIEGNFDYVVGNPPYVRQESIPDVLVAEYRRRYATVYDRADLYIPFIERSLRLLGPTGVLGFICADRWTKNRYGRPLRELVSAEYHLRTYVDMVGTPAFGQEVVAYPGVFVIARERGRETRIAHRPEITAASLTALAQELTDPRAQGSRMAANLAQGGEPWIMEAGDGLALVRRLEAAFPTLEEAGCKVGIGVATGADQAFIAPYAALDVEPDRKLPLVMTRDILSGYIEWRGLGVVNPFGPDGRLVSLAAYPRLRRYLEANRDAIAGRHVAKKAPANWYRTIDRIYPELVAEPKLLIPDIKGEAHIVYDPGGYYPHHNLYFITTAEWDLRALQVVLRAGIARLFVAAYSTKMRGGFLRFQAQYLRRIRLPAWEAVSAAVRRDLLRAAETGSAAAGARAVASLYGLSEAEQACLRGEAA